jgi:SlyX protein
MEEQRFIAIETKISHQEVMLEDLHEVLYKQQELIEQLQKRIKKLEDQIQNEIRGPGEKPPHY